jgi:spore coat polysaccharide biosynthesis protein SpsF (cytidylyltransferase family)
MSRTVVIVQARLGSTRLPGKVLQDIGGKPMLVRVIERARAIPFVADVVVATSSEPRDAAILALAASARVEVFAGSELDVLDRFYQAARGAAAGSIVRITADCPLLDPGVSGRAVERFHRGDVDYVSNCLTQTFPDGLDTEVFSFDALERAWHDATLMSEREHVTPYIWKHPQVFRVAEVGSAVNLSGHRWTVDTEDDLEFVRGVYRRLDSGTIFGMEEVLDLLRREPDLRRVDPGGLRNSGYARSLAEEP